MYTFTSNARLSLSVLVFANPSYFCYRNFVLGDKAPVTLTAASRETKFQILLTKFLVPLASFGI